MKSITWFTVGFLLRLTLWMIDSSGPKEGLPVVSVYDEWQTGRQTIVEGSGLKIEPCNPK